MQATCQDPYYPVNAMDPNQNAYQADFYYLGDMPFTVPPPQSYYASQQQQQQQQHQAPHPPPHPHPHMMMHPMQMQMPMPMHMPMHMPPRQRELIEPHDNDCLLGRGGKNNQHVGNENLRGMARAVREKYRKSTKKVKSNMSRDLVQKVRNLDPPGRFLERNPVTNEWEDVGDERAREKVSQVLRDAVSEYCGPKAKKAATASATSASSSEDEKETDATEEKTPETKEEEQQQQQQQQTVQAKEPVPIVSAEVPQEAEKQETVSEVTSVAESLEQPIQDDNTMMMTSETSNLEPLPMSEAIVELEAASELETESELLPEPSELLPEPSELLPEPSTTEVVSTAAEDNNNESSNNTDNDEDDTFQPLPVEHKPKAAKRRSLNVPVQSVPWRRNRAQNRGINTNLLKNFSMKNSSFGASESSMSIGSFTVSSNTNNNSNRTLSSRQLVTAKQLSGRNLMERRKHNFAKQYAAIGMGDSDLSLDSLSISGHSNSMTGSFRSSSRSRKNIFMEQYNNMDMGLSDFSLGSTTGRSRCDSNFTMGGGLSSHNRPSVIVEGDLESELDAGGSNSSSDRRFSEDLYQFTGMGQSNVTMNTIGTFSGHSRMSRGGLLSLTSGPSMRSMKMESTHSFLTVDELELDMLDDEFFDDCDMDAGVDVDAGEDDADAAADEFSSEFM